MRKHPFGLSALFSAFALTVAITICEVKPLSAASNQPIDCISFQFSTSGSEWWKLVTLTLTNNCREPVDLQNAIVTFGSKTPINTTFWGNFSPLPYPDSNRTIITEQSGSNLLATLNLHFPSSQGSSTLLPTGRSIQITYGVSLDTHVEGSANISLSSSPNTCILFTPYQQMSSNMSGNEPQDLVSVSQQTGIKSFNLAFIKDNGVCEPIWSGNNSVASGWGQELMANMRKAGIDYRISFGGADPRDLSIKCSVYQLISIYQNIINTYQPSGLDFDIENNLVNIPTIITALKTIVTNNPELKISFTLPVMPAGLGALGKKVISEATKANLNYVVNIMVMDYGSAYTRDMAAYAMEAATNTFNYLRTAYPQKSSDQVWQIIALTPMIGVNDIPGELFSLANTDTLNEFAQKHSIAWLSMWSLGRDRPCSDTKANSQCSGANAQSKTYEFSEHMLQCSKTPLPTKDCLPPSGIVHKLSSDKKAITLNWQTPQNSQPILNYQVNNYKDIFLWEGRAVTFTDGTLTGGTGTYDYVLYSQCASGLSKGIRYSVIVE